MVGDTDGEDTVSAYVSVHHVAINGLVVGFATKIGFLCFVVNDIIEVVSCSFDVVRRVFNQLIELGIVESCKSPHHVPNSQFRRVLMHNQDEISRLIDMFS